VKIAYPLARNGVVGVLTLFVTIKRIALFREWCSACMGGGTLLCGGEAGNSCSLIFHVAVQWTFIDSLTQPAHLSHHYHNILLAYLTENAISTMMCGSDEDGGREDAAGGSSAQNNVSASKKEHEMKIHTFDRSTRASSKGSRPRRGYKTYPGCHCRLFVNQFLGSSALDC
jgi:hypothetical protein